MSKSFFLFFSIGMIFTFLLLFSPIFLRTVAHYDMNRKKFCFSIYLFSFIKLLGGYIATYDGGLAVHLSDKKAYLLPYLQMNNERKRFSFTRAFRWKYADFTTETGAEYLLLNMILHTVFRTLFFLKKGKRKNLRNNVWLIDGDVFRASISLTVYFNVYLLLKNLFVFVKEKLQILWRKKAKNSVT